MSALSLLLFVLALVSAVLGAAHVSFKGRKPDWLLVVIAFYLASVLARMPLP